MKIELKEDNLTCKLLDGWLVQSAECLRQHELSLRYSKPKMES